MFDTPYAKANPLSERVTANLATIFDYHSFTFHELLLNNAQGSAVSVAESDRESVEGGRGLDFDLDKTMTLTYCRFDAKARLGIERVLVVDFDEFLYCSEGTSDLQRQRAYIAHYVEQVASSGIEQLQVNKTHLRKRDPKEKVADCLYSQLPQHQESATAAPAGSSDGGSGGSARSLSTTSSEAFAAESGKGNEEGAIKISEQNYSMHQLYSAVEDHRTHGSLDIDLSQVQLRRQAASLRGGGGGGGGGRGGGGGKRKSNPKQQRQQLQPQQQSKHGSPPQQNQQQPAARGPSIFNCFQSVSAVDNEFNMKSLSLQHVCPFTNFHHTCSPTQDSRSAYDCICTAAFSQQCKLVELTSSEFHYHYSYFYPHIEGEADPRDPAEQGRVPSQLELWEIANGPSFLSPATARHHNEAA